MARDNENILEEWCLIESNPCIFYDMLKRMGATEISVEDVYSLSYFDDYINNKEIINMNHILGVDTYLGENNKTLDKENNVVDVIELYKNNICMEDKYNKLLKHHSYIYGIIFLFNIGKHYKNNKYIEHNVPDNLFFAKQVIPNACATQAILSIVLNKDIELNDEIKNIKTFSLNFDSSMKGLTLSNCTFLRNIHNSYKPPIYLDKEDVHHDKKKSEDSFHFVSYISFQDKVYLLDENVKNFKLKKDIFEDSYLKLLIENEKIEQDAPSCYFLSYLYNNIYLYYCDILFHNKNKQVHSISHIERDINFFNYENVETKKKKKINKSEEIIQNNIRRNNKNLIYIKGDEEKYINKKYINDVNDQNNLYNLNELYKVDKLYNIDKLHFITSHYLAYNKMQNSILQFYIPNFNMNKISKFDKHIKGRSCSFL
ncbi:hypothetical protein C923_03359 [Plasmodium falciparum UGT5.1]|uniref:ubiquitinyl hydrolase 1 n=1 Tax=Plasmodium falciparum UGT5.1 TaxID=1237627 RepID=W7JAV5_PLAFA|nr:hypothetical protein C923_03359 [Plasmodium falciparum UGT5.1]